MFIDLMQHFRHLERILRRRGRTREEAHDLIQESFLRVQVYLNEGGEIREPEAFLVRTALNLSRDMQEREHRDLYASKPVEELLVLDTSPTPDEVAQAEDRLKRLDSALNRAGPRAREIFIMHRINGLSYIEISNQLGITRSAIEKHMAHAMTVLAQELLKS